MTSWLQRVPPAGEPLRPRREPGRDARRLAPELERMLDVKRVDLTRSGREALRRALRVLARRSERGEVVVPGYTCPSVAAAVVAAGLRVRLVEVTPRGGIDPAALAAAPLERAAAVVVCNLFGIPEPLPPLAALARDAGVAIVDDAAQAFGARDAGGPVGARGDVGVLSFARGKPLGALGGGAVAWRIEPPEHLLAPRGGGRARAALAARLHDAALDPRLFPWVARLPFLHVGRTRFDPGFRRGEIDPAAARLVAQLLPGHERHTAQRAERLAALAARIADETRFVPLTPGPGAGWAAPRLALRAPDEASAARTRRELAAEGAARLYPASLDAWAALRPHRSERSVLPGARRLAALIVTLPPTAPTRGPAAEALVARLRTIAPPVARARL